MVKIRRFNIEIMETKYSIYFIFFLTVFYTTEVSALKCYTCTVNAGDVDQRCVTDPASVENGSPITNCNKKYCTSRRVEYKDPANKVHSVFRGCDDDPERMNTIEEDDQFITYYKACTQPLCNGGSGKGNGDGGSFDDDPSAGGVLIIPGMGNTSTCIKINFLFVMLGTIITSIYYTLFKN